MIREVKPSKFISHLEGLKDAPELYERLNDGEKGMMQVVFKYGDL